MIEILNTDCMEYMKGLEDNAFDLAIVDPPYGIDVGKQRLNSNRATAKWKNPSRYDYKTFDDSSAPNADYFYELMRVSKNQIIWGANYFTEHLPASKGWIVWDKKADIKEHLSMCELAFSSFDKKCNKFEFLWAGFKKAVQEKRIHPTQKPVKLYEWLLSNYAKEGDRILDTHLGSGSSAIAAHYGGFDFVGCELDEDYFKAAQARFEKETAQIDIFQ
jgi:site-specific DNA-methyltransferase (adenine-specific)